MAEAQKPTSSQEIIESFWKSTLVPEKPPTKVTTILPPGVLGRKAPQRSLQGIATAENATKSYESARNECVAKVAKIVRECRRINGKYSDPYFDLSAAPDDCLTALSNTQASGSNKSSTPPLSGEYNLVNDGATAGRIELYANDSSSDFGDSHSFPSRPPSVKRVPDIFDNPRFFVDGASSKDIRQGYDGDCWFLSAIAALCSLDTGEQLLEKVCPAEARDPEVGVYGFLLFRDGEWISVVIDDKLFLTQPDYDYSDGQVKGMWEQSKVRYDAQEEYRKAFQSNSRALYYAQSTHPDETWVPLLEKAFAKAHGDYNSIEGGSVGEGVEDLTGGISVTIDSTNILSKEKFWTEGLLHVNKDFLFGLGTRNWFDPEQKGSDGIQGGHAYSVLRAVNYGKERLVLIKNPWGQSEWNGPWSDGSSQWTSQAIQDLNYTFGDDGVFWMRYSDMLRKYNTIWRTRLFGPEWNVTTQWTQASVPWAGETRDPRFNVTISQDATTVIVLSQLDDRYFRGLSGQYEFRLSFRLYKEGEEDYFMRTLGESWSDRSTSVEVDLEAGKYEVRLHISAQRIPSDKVEDVVKSNWLDRTDKLLRIGASYDYAHAKGQPFEEEAAEPTKSESKAVENAPTSNAAPVPINTAATPVMQDTTPTTQSTKPETSTSPANPPAIPTESSAGAPSSTSNPPPMNTNESYNVGASPATVIGDSEAQQAPNAGDIAAASEKDAEKPAEETPKDPEADGKEEDAVEPWGAVCVVGLRVYCKNASATVEVLRSKKGGSPKPNLDVDNPSKDVANSTA